MKPFPILLLSLALANGVTSQTIWPVQVGGSLGSPTPPFYNPQALTIEVGDIVLWTNTSGTHNVNGSTDVFPANPEGFVSGAPQGGTWSFQHTFNIPGVYHYHCTQTGHSATQFGTITVIDPTSTGELTEAQITLFPVPAADLLVAELGGLKVRSAEIIALDGHVAGSQSVNGASRVEIPVTALAAGHYYLRLLDAEGKTIVRPFRKD